MAGWQRGNEPADRRQPGRSRGEARRAGAPLGSGVGAGQTFSTQPVVDEEDQYGNLETGDNSTLVTAALSSSGGRLMGNATVLVRDGVATFSGLGAETAGATALVFSAGNLTSAKTGTVTISPAAASQWAIHTPPSATATAGQAFLTQPVIYEEDQYGNLITTDSATQVTVSLGSGTGPLQGTKSVIVSGGVATFAGLFDEMAETITQSFSGGGLTAATSFPIVVSPATPTKLVQQTPPTSTATAGQAFLTQFVVDEEDQYGNLVTTDNATQVTAGLEQLRRPARGEWHRHRDGRGGDIHRSRR